MTPDPRDSRAPAVKLQADSICRSFGLRRVIRSVTLAVSSGEVLAIRGPNGSGKSTLLRLLAGLLRPAGGESWVEVQGERVAPEERRNLVALAAPAIQPYVHLTLAENLLFFGMARGGVSDQAELAELAGLIGLADRQDDLVGSFSSGMLQRTRLAIALAARAPVLLLDEPSQCLDEAGRALVAEVVNGQRERGLCVLATNDDSDAALADRDVVLEGQPSS